MRCIDASRCQLQSMIKIGAYITACAVLVDALTNVFLNLVQLRITIEAS
jgi:hypothetical protein